MKNNMLDELRRHIKSHGVESYCDCADVGFIDDDCIDQFVKKLRKD